IHFYNEQGFETVRSYQPEMYGEVMNLALMKKTF
ncbi:MAG: GNAT family N-acetyltransferase, partial [Staphylococcus sp.]|nr:GNAT family N-acetyltransferase [Staphylococcus sp.]